MKQRKKNKPNNFFLKKIKAPFHSNHTFFFFNLKPGCQNPKSMSKAYPVVSAQPSLITPAYSMYYPPLSKIKLRLD